MHVIFMGVALTGFQGTKKDATASREIEASRHADDGVYDAVKRIVSKDFLDPVNTVSNEIYRLGSRFGAASGFRGLYVVPETNRERFVAEFERLSADRDLAVEAMLSDYDNERAKRAIDMGDAFNEADYPLPSQIRSRFTAKLRYLPIPNIAAVPDAPEAVKEGIEAERRSVFESVHADIWGRLEDGTRSVIEKMSKDGFKPGLMVTTLSTLIDSLESLNIWDDPKLSNALDTLKSEICAVSPESLKYDDMKRHSAMAAARRVLDVALNPGDVPNEKPAPVPAPTPVAETIPAEESVDDFMDFLD